MAKKRRTGGRPGPSRPRPQGARSTGARTGDAPRPPAERPAASPRPAGPAGRQDRLRQPPVGGTPAIVRGASWGFSILLVGELVALQLLGLGNGLILYVVAAAAYALAGNRAVTPPVASVGRAARDGAMAAGLAYALTIPLRIIVKSASTSPLATVVALAFAVLVGGLAGAIVGRARIDEAAGG